METKNTETATVCPHCQKGVDPLRAGAVSILNGRITHFCSADCREAFLERSDAHAVLRDKSEVVAPDKEDSSSSESVPSETPVGENDPVDSQTASATGLSNTGLSNSGLSNSGFSNSGFSNSGFSNNEVDNRRSNVLWRLFVPHLLEAVPLVFLAIGVAFVPRNIGEGWLLTGLALLGVILALVFGIIRERPNGIFRVLEMSMVPFGAILLIGVALSGNYSRFFEFSAILLLLVDKLGRIVELILRHRTGITDIVAGNPPRLLASEWRDNSPVTAGIRWLTLTLEWARLPVSLALGFSVWFFGGFGLFEAVLCVATCLMALNPRPFRMATGDAYLAVALRGVRNEVIFRDANAVHRVGSARIALFMTRHVLVKPTVRVIDWRVVDGFDESRILSALGSVESAADDRYSAAILEFISSSASVDFEETSLERISGKGVMGDTVWGRIMCGTRTMFLDNCISNGEFEEWARGVESTGRRALFVSLDNSIVAMFGVEEQPESDIPEVLQQLSMLGVEPAMVTSAEVDSAFALGARLGIENVKFEKGEQDLESVISELASTGDTVLLVGKGHAFEEGLRMADAAIATNSEKSMAGVDAKHNSIAEIVQVIKAARGARRSVQLNIAAASFVVLIGLCLAIGWYSPLVTLFVGGLVAMACVLSTLNGPYPLLKRIGTKIERWAIWSASKLGLRRS